MKRRNLVEEDEESSGIEVANPRLKCVKAETPSNNSNGLLTPDSGRRSARTRPVGPTPTDSEIEENNSSNEASDSDEGHAISAKKQKRYRSASHLAICGPAYPRSTYEGWQPPLPPVSEWKADALLRRGRPRSRSEDADGDRNWTIFRLDNFTVYRPPSGHQTHCHELVTLDRLRQDRYLEFYFDGVLSNGQQSCYVQGIPFEIITVDEYGDDGTNVKNQICIQSKNQAKRNDGAWYQLGSPAAEYRRFYHPFLWLVRFGKYFVAYLLETKRVTLRQFEKEFSRWLQLKYGNDKSFQKWLQSCGNLRDFRTTVAANPIWSETDPLYLKAIPEQPNVENMTVVTPFAFECFRSMYFGDRLVERTFNSKMLQLTRRRKEKLGLTPVLSERCERPAAAWRMLPTPVSMDDGSPEPVFIDEIGVGDVVRVRPDAGGVWREPQHAWFAYVQDVRTHADRTLLDVLWLYEPKDTTLGKAYYPYANELFLSDNCSCGKDALDLACVLQKADVSFTRDPQEGLFVRRKFRTVHEQDTYDFIDLQDSDFRCSCDKNLPIFQECCNRFSVGDTVLVRGWCQRLKEDRLEPAQIVQFDYARHRIHVRLFGRKRDLDPSARPNELTPPRELQSKSADKVIRKCNVRYFTPEQIATREITTPYDRDGTGDYFYVTRDQVTKATAPENRLPFPDSDGNLVYEGTAETVPPFQEGWDPTRPTKKPKLIGMGIFCGGGTFDRGLEEGGGVRFQYAVDWAEKALHSHRANAAPGVKYFLGSVNDYLAKAMAGSREPEIAKPGDFNVLSAGSPCPGFSALQVFKLSLESKQNASMVASVVSFVDFFVPEYLILENVVTMTHGMGPRKDENVFAQIVAALVGLGYQVQQSLMDAWSYGSSQQRSRVFIIASALGLAPLRPPPHSHSHPPNATSSRALGTSSNGKRFGSRRDEFTAFEHVTPAEAVDDLPFIGDCQPQLCPAFPDHRTAVHDTANNRGRIEAVPLRPHGMGLVQAKAAGLVRGEPLEHCQKLNHVRSQRMSKIYSRVKPDFLFPTIVTRLAINDGINGRVAHWSQQRTITNMEARRAQGYLDHEVLIGTPVDQLKIVGNSVDRKVALVLGLALGESWIGSDRNAESERPIVALHAAADEDHASAITAEEKEDDNAVIMGASFATAEVDDVDDSPENAANSDEDPDVNRNIKMALNLSAEELEEIRIGQFPVIKRILNERAIGRL